MSCNIENFSSGIDKNILGYSRSLNYMPINYGNPEKIIRCNIAPGWYADLTQSSIGNRQVYVSRNIESELPKTLIKSHDTMNLTNKTVQCSQPYWNANCI